MKTLRAITILILAITSLLHSFSICDFRSRIKELEKTVQEMKVKNE